MIVNKVQRVLFYIENSLSELTPHAFAPSWCNLVRISSTHKALWQTSKAFDMIGQVPKIPIVYASTLLWRERGFEEVLFLYFKSTETSLLDFFE